jgi:hypothetical protein
VLLCQWQLARMDGGEAPAERKTARRVDVE